VKKELADFIIKACKHNDLLFYNQGLELPELREKYQGESGLFNSHEEPSFAIVFDCSILTLMAAIAIESFELGDEYGAVPVDFSQLAKLNQGSMGTGTVIY
jgi:hypothetical protein